MVNLQVADAQTVSRPQSREKFLGQLLGNGLGKQVESRSSELGLEVKVALLEHKLGGHGVYPDAIALERAVPTSTGAWRHTRQAGLSQPLPEGSTLAGPLRRPSRGPRHFGRAQGTPGERLGSAARHPRWRCSSPVRAKSYLRPGAGRHGKRCVALRMKTHPSLSGEGFERRLQPR